jgi:hypothetical protein
LSFQSSEIKLINEFFKSFDSIRTVCNIHSNTYSPFKSQKNTQGRVQHINVLEGNSEIQNAPDQTQAIAFTLA